MIKKSLKWLSKNWPYLVLTITVFIASIFFFRQTDVYLEIEGVRTVTSVMATILGIFAGLLGFLIASIIQVAISERQYQQSLLRNESQRFEDWLTKIPNNIKRKRDIADLPDIIRDHSIFPTQPSEELLELLRDKFAVFQRIFKTWARKTQIQQEIQKAHSEFDVHYLSVAAIVIKLSHAEGRLEIARSLTRYLWMLGMIFFFHILILILSFTTLAQEFEGDWGTLVILLTVVSFGFILGVIIGISDYFRIESRSATFTLPKG